MDENEEMALRDEMLAHKERAVAWLTAAFGETCPDFEPDCILCQKWKALEFLFDDWMAD